LCAQPQIEQGFPATLSKEWRKIMRTHNKTFHIRLTEKEYERLCKYSKKAGLPKSTYIRFMIDGQSPKDSPLIEYHKMMNELRHIGNNLNQLARLVHCYGSIDYKRLNEILDNFNEKYIEIVKAVLLPVERDKDETLERGRLQAEKDMMINQNAICNI
jgi:hypothetical protein